MTCIAAVAHNGVVTMGADSAATCYNFDIMSINSSKMFRLLKGQVLVGVCGSGRAQDLLEFNLTLPALPKRDTDIRRWIVREFIPRARLVYFEGGFIRQKNGVEGFGDSAMLIGVRGQIFHLYGDFQTEQGVLPYAAIGSGGPFARGSLFSTANIDILTPRERVREALEAAERFNAGVRGPFKIIEGS